MRKQGESEMSFAEFGEKVTRKAHESGFFGDVLLSQDNGKFIAHVGDVVFIGNSACESVLICWGCASDQ